MLKPIMPTVNKVTKDVEDLQARHKNSQPDPNRGVKYRPFEYFMKPQNHKTTRPRSGGVGLFPKTLSEDAFQKAVKSVKAYQAELLDRHKFTEED